MFNKFKNISYICLVTLATTLPIGNYVYASPSPTPTPKVLVDVSGADEINLKTNTVVSFELGEIIFEGKDDNSILEIDEDKTLTLVVDKEKSKNIEPNKKYTIMSRVIVPEEIRNRIILKNAGAKLHYDNNDKIVAISFEEDEEI